MNEDSKKIFSDNLVYYMAKKHISRKCLCEDLGFKYPTVSEWISAKKYPRIDKIEILASYFGIKKSDLIEKHDFDQQAINSISNENTTITGTQANIINNFQELDEYTQQLINIFQTLTITQKAKAILIISEMSEANK